MRWTKKITTDIVDTLDLSSQTRNVNVENELLDIFSAYLNEGGSNVLMLPIGVLDGYMATPDRYWIRCSTPRVCVLVEYDEANPMQRFEWSSNDSSDKIVITREIKKTSLVFLQVQGDKLSYSNGNKLLYVECEPEYIHPITILFEDMFGIPQTIQLETGAWASTYKATNTFRSLSRDIEFALEKTASHALTVGDNYIPRQLQMFLNGLVTSRAYKVMCDEGLGNNKTLIMTSLSNPQLVADSFTKSYSFTGVLQFNSTDIPKLLYSYGEINIV